jgi:DNA-binding transcriptional MerR regulator
MAKAATSENALTIEELAQRSGMTVRNIRSHRARGLLPAPEVRGRVGYYGPVHLDRLRLIRELQAEGLNLEGIKKLIAQTGGSGPFLDLKQALSTPLQPEEPRVFSAQELTERFGTVTPAVLRNAEKIGVLMPIDEDSFEAPAPSLLDVAEELVGLGVPLDHALAVVRKVDQRCREIAKEFVRLFINDVVRPTEKAGSAGEGLAGTVSAVDRLLPLSSNVVLAIYKMTMSREVESAFSKELRRLTK